jgi:glycosyltransferase involved in cell wall biosynthesis
VGISNCPGGGDPIRRDAVSGGLLASVIVAVRDQPAGLSRLVSALAAQTLPRERFEVIVVDDGSQRPLLLPGADGVWLRLVRQRPSNAYVARNRAAELARGPVLAFTDGDCRPRADWLAAALAAIGDHDLLAGRIQPLLPARPSGWAVIDAMLFDQERFVEIGKAATANLLVRRAIFQRHGGFDSSLPSGGDWELVERCVRDGARLRYAPLAIVEHPVRSGALEFLRRRWRIEHAFGMRCGRERVSLLAFNGARTPVVPRRWGFAVGYDGGRLSALGVANDKRLATVPARYLIIPAVDALAQLSGWLWARLGG